MMKIEKISIVNAKFRLSNLPSLLSCVLNRWTNMNIATEMLPSRCFSTAKIHDSIHTKCIIFPATQTISPQKCTIFAFILSKDYSEYFKANSFTLEEFYTIQNDKGTKYAIPKKKYY